MSLAEKNKKCNLKQIVVEAVLDLENDVVPEGCDESYVYSTPAEAVTIDNVEEVAAVYNK